MNLKHVVLAAMMTPSALTAAAQTQAQAPGLWEHTMRVKSQDGQAEQAMAEMQKQLAAMPPERRKQLEQAMASRGVSMGAQGSTSKVCLGKEEAARAAEPKMPGDCVRKDVQRNGNSMTFKFECTKPRPSSGEGEMTFISDKAYSGKTSVTTEVAGKSQQMTMEMSGKWISSDCGDIKPLVMPKQ
jgi:Protein of unknown function (DUF3617)